MKNCEVHLSEKRRIGGYIKLENINIRWFLSINFEDLLASIKMQNISAYRSIKIDSKEIEFTEGFTDLHTKTYEKILLQEGFGIKMQEIQSN